MAISNHPAIVSISAASEIERGTILSRYILIIFAVLFLISLFRIPQPLCPILKRFILYFFLIFTIGLFIYAIYNNQDMLSSLRMFLIVFASIFIGWTLTPSKHQLSILLLVFGGTVIYSGLMQITTNIGGFIIADLYLADNKNSLGAMLASAVIAFIFLWHNNRKSFFGICSVVLAIICIIILITIRARAAVIAAAIVSVFFLFTSSKSPKHVLLVFLIIPILLIIFHFLPPSLSDYIYSSFFAGSQGDDISSGRLGTYKLAFDYFVQNPFFGDVKNLTQIPWIHNFPLLHLYKYGLLFSWPVLVLYLTLLIYAIRYSLKKNRSLFYCGYMVLLIPFFISLLEPTFPFGPGTATVLNFILFGIAERFRAELEPIVEL